MIRRAALVALLALAPALALAQDAAEKVLRVSFPIAETGFDPQDR